MSPDGLVQNLLREFRRTRELTLALVEPLSAEDCAIQSMPDVSPTRWHLAHTTWFFETFLLKQRPHYTPFHPSYEYLFNSYYNTVGEQFPRERRGTLSRPPLAEILDYRRHVEEQLVATAEDWLMESSQQNLIRIGIEHERQHQELMLTDIKHVLGCNPLLPTYRASQASSTAAELPLRYCDYAEDLYEIGHNGNGFAFDNESPRHKSYLGAFQLANRCVTNGEYLNFMADGGYRRPELWLSMGWQAVCKEKWRAPLYWHLHGGKWHEFTLAGLLPLQASSPVCHVSYFEADAFARWSGARLPTEFEWEVACCDAMSGNFADNLMAHDRPIHPQATEGHEQVGDPPPSAPKLQQMLGDVWEWTCSQYLPYPGYAPSPGALGEYNGKFMCNQFVLRGGSCATPTAEHMRHTYRNFFPPEARWQFSGIRLCRTGL
jgi:ergothioneine biosynthesis protein EgtB